MTKPVPQTARARPIEWFLRAAADDEDQRFAESGDMAAKATASLHREAAAKIEELRVAAVAAAMPLEAMILGGTWKLHSADVQASIKAGAVKVRDAIADV